MYIICRQLSVMTSSGVNIVHAFDTIKSQFKNKKTLKALNLVMNQIESGESLYVSLEKSKKFPENFVNMVRIGENSGNLDKIFQELSEYYYKEYKIKQTLKSSLSYPIFILVVTILASIVISLTILPMICTMIEELELKELPLSTKVLININSILNNELVFPAFIGIIIGIILIIYLKRISIVRFILFRTPIINNIYKKVLSARFARALAMLFNSGIPIINALEMCETLIGGVYKNAIKNIRRGVESGENLYITIKKNPVFPEFFCNMIETGEESGRLDFVLSKIGEFYEKEVEFSIKKVTKIFEPSLIIGLSVVVGFLLASIMIPLFQIYGEV